MHTPLEARRGGQRMLNKLGLPVFAVLVMVGLPLVGQGQTVTLTPSVTSPQMVGTPITWTATVQNAPAGHTYDYQFSVTYNGQTQIVSDFSPTATFTWVPHTVEGAYMFNVVVRDITTTPVLFAPVSVPFTLLPWVTAPLAAGAVNPTSHPLVALFSGPPCTLGHQLLIRFQPATPTASQNPNAMTTNLVPCSQQSANFYVAGMYPSSKYLMHWEEYAGTTLVNTGSNLSFTAGPLPASFPHKTYTVNVPPQAYDASYPVDLFFSGPDPSATDLLGNVIWYLPISTVNLTRMEPGGNFYAYPASGVLQYDLAGNVVLQTNVEILDEQLAAKGYPTITAFNTHEARTLPDGNIVLIGYRTVVSTSAQGGTPANPVTILGDMLLVVDHNLQLVWAWDSFAHEDINRASTDNDLCAPGGGGCPSGLTAKDWLHTNAVQGTVDGNIIISQRSQDMVLKINYARGKGDGSVIWRMGAGLDFTIANPPSGTCTVTSIPGDPNVIPWFTHQHDAHFDFEDDASGDGFMIMTVFDDGNTRHDMCPGTQNSRGMVLLVDEAARQVYAETVADLGGYSAALGSAQLLTPADGNIYASFDSGFLNNATETQVSEVNLAGQIVYQMQLNQSDYRAYRMQNLYTPSEFEVTPPAGILGTLPPGQPFDYSAGFAQDQDAFQFNGSSSLAGNSLELTNGESFEASSVFYSSPVNVQSFTTDFTFQLTNPNADGFTFTIQNVGPGALGANGGSLGYAGIGNSVAIKFDLLQNAGDVSNNSTGIFVDGAIPIGPPSIDLTGSGINLHSGDQIHAHITYNGTTLILMLTDVVTSATWSHPFTINIPATVGGSTAYVGFTGGTGYLTSTQQVLNWSYETGQAPYNPAGFASGAGLSTNGSASLSGTSLQLTNGGLNQAGSAFFAMPVNVQSFNTDFKFKLTNAIADGFTFTIQNVGPTALGAAGGSLGYAGIGSSVAVKFDIFQNAGDPSNDCTGIFVDGAIPIGPTSIDLTGSGINLHSSDEIDANLTYNGDDLTLTLTDLVTLATWSHPFAINIPAIVGGNTAYVGFTAGTGGASATQQILSWTFE